MGVPSTFPRRGVITRFSTTASTLHRAFHDLTCLPRCSSPPTYSRRMASTRHRPTPPYPLITGHLCPSHNPRPGRWARGRGNATTKTSTYRTWIPRPPLNSTLYRSLTTRCSVAALSSRHVCPRKSRSYLPTSWISNPAYPRRSLKPPLYIYIGLPKSISDPVISAIARRSGNESWRTTYSARRATNAPATYVHASVQDDVENSCAANAALRSARKELPSASVAYEHLGKGWQEVFQG